jgi:cell division protein FtsQ
MSSVVEYGNKSSSQKQFHYTPLTFNQFVSSPYVETAEKRRTRSEKREHVSRPGKSGTGKKTRESKSPLNKFFLFVIITLTCILVLEIVFNFLVAPRLEIRQIKITTDTHIELTNRQIMDIAGIDSHMFFYNVDVREMKTRLENYPAIREATVEKAFPDTLQISILGRVPIAIALVETQDATVPVALDKEGVIFQIGDSISDWNNPVISGVKFPEVQLGMKLPEKLVTFLHDIEQVKQKKPVLLDVISEFRFVKKNNIGFEVLIYPRDYQVPVRVGSKVDQSLIKYILMVLDVVSQKEYYNNIAEIDCRTDEIVYRFKEG